MHDSPAFQVENKLCSNRFKIMLGDLRVRYYRLTGSYPGKEDLTTLDQLVDNELVEDFELIVFVL
jgi:hypothetical protein